MFTPCKVHKFTLIRIFIHIPILMSFEEESNRLKTNFLQWLQLYGVFTLSATDCYPIASVSVSALGSMNTSTQFFITHFYRCQCLCRCRSVWIHHKRGPLSVMYLIWLKWETPGSLSTCIAIFLKENRTFLQWIKQIWQNDWYMNLGKILKIHSRFVVEW